MLYFDLRYRKSGNPNKRRIVCVCDFFLPCIPPWIRTSVSLMVLASNPYISSSSSACLFSCSSLHHLLQHLFFSAYTASQKNCHAMKILSQHCKFLGMCRQTIFANCCRFWPIMWSGSVKKGNKLQVVGHEKVWSTGCYTNSRDFLQTFSRKRSVYVDDVVDDRFITLMSLLEVTS